jgi:hypothetical protein
MKFETSVRSGPQEIGRADAAGTGVRSSEKARTVGAGRRTLMPTKLYLAIA